MTRERLIQTAPAGDRAQLVSEALEFFRIDTSGLTKQQQFDIALEQIRARAQRFRIITTAVFLIALLAALPAAFAISKQVGGTVSTRTSATHGRHGRSAAPTVSTTREWRRRGARGATPWPWCIVSVPDRAVITAAKS
jgi:hypothetical protein